jgi:formylglycine-generating enzyme
VKPWPFRSACLWAWFCALSLGACDLRDPDDDAEQGGGGTAAAAPARSSVGAVESSEVGATALPGDAGRRAVSVENAAAPASPRCPELMLEVHGLFCTDLMHRCTKGGATSSGEDTNEPEPFYCDVYQPGFAKCLGKEEPKRFCIDEYEYPNEPGAIPMVMVSWYEARRRCELQGKRLCGDDEWTLACEGPERLPYPYGWIRDSTACNIDHPWIRPDDGILGSDTASPADVQAEVDRLSKRVAAGSMPRCRSPYGVFDMTGNVDEWVVNVTLHAKPYASAFMGGHWVRGARNRCRPVTANHDEKTVYYAEGFRCCAALE